MQRLFPRIKVALLVVGVIIGVGALLAFLAIRGITSHGGDCGWSTSARAWVDANGNGTQDSGEPPLEDVRIIVNDTLNRYPDVGSRAVTTWEGTTSVSVWLPGCPSARFELVAEPPTGYRSTTDRVVAIQGEGYGDRTPLAFGFALLPGVPSPTPYVAGLTCVSEARRSYDLEVSPDGVLWMVTDDALARYQPATQTWQTYPISTTMMLWSDSRLQVGSDETVWIDSFREAGYLRDGVWTDSLGEESLLSMSVPSLGTSRDGRIWFIKPYGANDLVAFDPATDTWQGLITNNKYHVEAVRLFTDGRVWRATFDRFAAASAPSPTPAGWTIARQHTFSSGELRPLPDTVRYIKAAALDAHNRLWVLHSKGVSSLDLATGDWTAYSRTAPEAVQNDSGSDMAISGDGSVWITSGSEQPRVFRLDPQRERWRSYDPRDGIPNAGQIEHLAVDRAGSIWFGFGSEEVLARCTLLQ